MKYFKLIRSGIDVAPLLEELRSQEDAWLIDTSRQDKIRVQRDTNTIFLSDAVHRPDLHINENQETRLTAVSKKFPRALAFLTEFAREMNCHLSRATIVRLKPESKVFRHIDEGSYYFLRDRFHLVLQSPAGSVLMSGGEEVRMQEGELWWFDNKQYHEARNESGDWRIHYIFDLLPADYADLAVNPIFVPGEPARSVAPASEPAAKPSPGDPRDIVSSAIRERAILHAENQRLISPKGNGNHWLIDMRRIFMDAKSLDAAAELFWQECGGAMPFQVGAMETAAIPFLSAILMKSLSRGTPVNGFIVRKERKTYGTGNSIEGSLTDAPIVMVDDVLNSGSSMEKAQVVLEQENKTIAFAFVLIDYESPQGAFWRKRRRHSSCRGLPSLRVWTFLRPAEAAADGDVSQQVALRLAGPEFLSPRSEVLSRHRRRARLLRQRLRRFLVSERARRIGGVEFQGSYSRAQESLVQPGAS